MEHKNDKVERILSIYDRLISGKVINKTEEALRFGVNERSVQRDIDDIRSFFESDIENKGYINQIIYSRTEKGFKLEQNYFAKLTNSEILAIAKILLESRAFTKAEIQEMLDKLVEGCVPYENQKLIKELVQNEAFHYIEPRHKTVFINKMWEIGQAIQQARIIEIEYQKMQGDIVKRRLKPVSIMFSEYYFYLIAFVDDEKLEHFLESINVTSPTIYRMDRIKSLNVKRERFHVPYSNRFEEGEFRKRVQFMYGGKLRKVKFKYTGPSIEAVQDRLPTARILEEGLGYYVVEAEVFGNGIDMWIRSQGDKIELISPKDINE